MSSFPALAKACPQPHLQLPDCILHHPRLEEGAGQEGGGSGAAQTGSNLGASPGSTRRRLSTSSSRQGMGGKDFQASPGEAQLGVCVGASDGCAGPWKLISGLSCDTAVRLELNVGDPGRGQWKRRQGEGAGAHRHGAAAGRVREESPNRSGPRWSGWPHTTSSLPWQRRQQP